MLTQFITIGILTVLIAMVPGPDFALVIKNSILHSRRAGIFTSLGVGSAILIHITYCLLGLAVVISQSLVLFSIIKYVGACYLIYLGITSLLAKPHEQNMSATDSEPNSIFQRNKISDISAFRQGFFCNLLNPKATLFFLSLFTVIIKPDTPFSWQIVYAVEMILILTGWLCGVTILLSHQRVVKVLNRVEKYVGKVLGATFIGFGIALAFVKSK